MGEHEPILRLPSTELTAAARKVVASALNRVGEDNDKITLRTATTFYQITDSKVTGSVSITSVELDRYGRPYHKIHSIDFPRENVNEETLLFLGVRERSDPDLEKKLITMAEELATAKSLSSETFIEAMRIASTLPDAPIQFSAPLRAAVAMSTSAVRRRLHALRA